MKIAIDIDGVLTNEIKGHNYIKRTVNEEAVKIVREIYKEHTVVLFTARFRIDRAITEDWLKIHDIPYDNIIFDKPSYDIFIDDKAFNSLILFKQTWKKKEKKH